MDVDQVMVVEVDQVMVVEVDQVMVVEVERSIRDQYKEEVAHEHHMEDKVATVRRSGNLTLKDKVS